MVIAPTIACAFNVTSGLIVNGICSYYEGIEEDRRMKEQEEALRRSIRLELQRNRKEETKQKRKREDDDSEIFELCLRAERRRKLIAKRIIASHQKSSENKEEIFRSDSLVDCLDDEEDEEADENKKSPVVDTEKILATAKPEPTNEKENMSSENKRQFSQSNNLGDGPPETKENDSVAEGKESKADYDDDDESSLVTVSLDSIDEPEKVSGESLSLDSIAL